MFDESLLPTEDEIIAAAVQHAREWGSRGFDTSDRTIGTGFPILHDGRPVAWVKYNGQPEGLDSEAYTQDYVYEVLHQQPALLEFMRVPEVLRIIETEEAPYLLLVMEYVPGQTVRRCLAGETTEERRDGFWGQILCALNTLLSLEPPPDTPPEPAGGGRITHMVFGEYCETEYAPRDFDSAQDLSNFFNETIGTSIDAVPFVNEDLKLCYCDPHQSNFLIPDDGGSICVIDFEHCFWLPPSFMKWALFVNFRDEIFEYSMTSLPVLQQLSETNQTALNQFHAELLRLERQRRGPIPPPPRP